MDYSSSNLILRQKNEEIKIVLPQVDEAPLGAVNMTLHNKKTQQEKVSRFYYFFSPYFELFSTIVVFPYKLL